MPLVGGALRIGRQRVFIWWQPGRRPAVHENRVFFM